MKYLYLIFRLFKCPHKDAIINKLKVTHKDDYDLKEDLVFICRCSKCGRIKETRI